MEIYQHIRLILKLRIVDYQKTEIDAHQGSIKPSNKKAMQLRAVLL